MQSAEWGQHLHKSLIYTDVITSKIKYEKVLVTYCLRDIMQTFQEKQRRYTECEMKKSTKAV